MNNGDPHSNPRTQVPGAIKAKLTLNPKETKKVQFELPQDMTVHQLKTKQDGPFLIRIKRDSTAPPNLIIKTGQKTFQEYLTQELPLHLATLVEEDFPQWEKTNHELLQAAESGDDEAFFSLLARDPRFFQSECALRRILTWRTQIDLFHRYFRNQSPGGQFWQTDPHHHQEAQHARERAHQNLHRLGQCQLALYDQRGKRPLPPADKVRGIYYGLLCLVKGLKQMHKTLQSKFHSEFMIETKLTEFVSNLKTLQGTSFFYPFIIAAAHLITDTPTRERAEIYEPSLSDLFLPQGVTPSTTAKAFTAAAFVVSEQTVERLCALNEPILLASTAEEDVYLGGTPTFNLLRDFPEISPLII